MSEPVPTGRSTDRRKPFRLGLSGVGSLAAIGMIALCFGELTDGSAFGKSGPANSAEGSASAHLAALSPSLRPLLEQRQWLNSRLDDEALRGKVVLVNFWTYSCINSLRPLPYLRAWAEKYRSRGLVIVGVHTPEFAFEQDPGNVRQAVAALGVSYPVVLDSDFHIWRDFGNQGWPGFYLIDANGRVRHQQLGEGDFAQTERWIEQLLSEKDGKTVVDIATPVRGTGIEAAADWANQRSPETYVGYAKANGFVSPGGIVANIAYRYAPATTLPLNRWDFSKIWTVGSEFAEPVGLGSTLRYRFHARDLHLVMGMTPGRGPVRFRVTIDGAPPGADHGVDIGADGWGEVRENRLYQLVRQSGAVRDRTFEIEFRAAGARAYAFTFG